MMTGKCERLIFFFLCQFSAHSIAVYMASVVFPACFCEKFIKFFSEDVCEKTEMEILTRQKE